MSQKLLISKPGYNALTETNPNNLIYSSDFDTLKYFANCYLPLSFPVKHHDGVGGGFDYTVGPGETVEATFRVRHNLGYYPFFSVFVKDFHTDSTFGETRYYPNSMTYKNSTPNGSFHNFVITAYATTTDIFGYLHEFNGSDNSYINDIGTYYLYLKIYRNNLGL